MHFKIYKITSPENKSYIGCTSTTLKTRFQNGRGYKKNKSLWNDIQTFGWENFKKEIIFQTTDKNEAFYAEEYLIYFYGDYNVSPGNNNKQKRKPVAQYTPQGAFVAQYASAQMACAQNQNFTSSGICRACTNHTLHQGFQWRWCDDANNVKAILKRKCTKNNRYVKSGNCPVIQYTKDGKFIAEYKSIKEASTTTGISKSTISQVCKNISNRKTAGGFVWKYK